jgi:DNA polymerase
MKPDLCESSGCALAKTGAGFTKVEVGARYASTQLLLVGEASGEAEARESLPFRPYAQSGSLLSDSLRAENISRADVAITNVLRCRPPKDWLEGSPWQSSSIYHCSLNYLDLTIKSIKPKVILALGGTAFRALVDAPKGKYGTLDYVRGYVHNGAGVATGCLVIPTYHPAYLRRGKAELIPLLRRDLKRAYLLAMGKLIEGKHYILDPLHSGLKYQTSPTIDEAESYLRSINPNLLMAYDIETPRSTRSDEEDRTSFTDRDIKLFQCTQYRGQGIALPFREEYIEVIKQILSKAPRKVGHNNWSFDDPVLAANGIKVLNSDDAMVAFGNLWSDLPKNLQAAAQMAGFPFPWKHYNDEALEFYGVCDVDATLCEANYLEGAMKGVEVN